MAEKADGSQKKLNMSLDDVIKEKKEHTKKDKFSRKPFNSNRGGGYKKNFARPYRSGPSDVSNY